MGSFIPTEFGETLMPIITGVSRTLIDLSKCSREIRGEGRSSPTASEHRELLQRTTAYADARATQDQCEALELELRGPDGAVIPTESIGIQDTEFLLALANEALEDIDYDDEAPFTSQADAEFREEWGRDPASVDDFFDELEDLEGDFAASTQESWDERTFPRYQIHVELVDEWSTP